MVIASYFDLVYYYYYMSEFIKPKALETGSVIGISAPSSSFSPEKFKNGVEILKSLGLKVKFSQEIASRKVGYLAGSDEERAAELSSMLNDPDIDAIMFARGGYGIQRIMPLLDFSSFKKNPKLVIGYSDLTALTSYITSSLKTVCLYGPVVTALSENNEVTIASLNRAIRSSQSLEPIQSQAFQVLKSGEAKGRLLGGCLSLLSSSIGTEYELKADGGILFIEDFNENIYKYDRMLTHLKNSGILKNVNGIVFGSMGLVEDEKPEQLWNMVSDVLSDFDGPVLAGLSSGHTAPFFTLPLGVECKLVTDEPGIIFEESALK